MILLERLKAVEKQQANTMPFSDSMATGMFHEEEFVLKSQICSLNSQVS